MSSKKASHAGGAKRKSKIIKEVLPSPNELKDGKHDYYIGNWSYYQSVQDICHISAALLDAHTQEDRRVAALPRVNVLLLPPAEERADAEVSPSQAASPTEGALHIEFVDNMHLEGVSRRALVASLAHVKDWKRNLPAENGESGAAEGATVTEDAAAEPDVTDEANKDTPAVVESPPTYEPDEVDSLEATPVVFGADFSARHARIAGHVSLEGVLPQMVVKPKLPAPPGDDASLLDTLAASRKASAVNDKKGKKGKKAPKLTQEEIEALELKRAEAEAEFQRLTEEAVQKAKEQEDYLMTFAHPDRWANVVVTNVTFTGPVVVRRAHVTFQNCTFTSAVAGAAQLTVSQYCRVNCSKCTFDAPVTAGVYALPTSEVEVSKCLFSGVPQMELARAKQASSTSLPAASSASVMAARGDEDDDDEGRNGEDGADATRGDAGAVEDRAVLPASVLATSVVAEEQRPAAVGVHADAARVQLAHSEFVFLGTAVAVRGRVQSTARMPAMKGLPTSSAGFTVQDCLLHYLFATGILVDDSARDVLIQRNHTADCAYYALDCHGGAKGVSVYRNHFSTNSVVRIREGCKPQFLENQLYAVPVDDNARENPALATAY